MVDLPAPKFVNAHAVLSLPQPTRRPDLDEGFIQAVRAEFPNVVSRQLLPADAPPNAPHVTLTSTSSQLLLSAAQADFQVGFYGDFVNDVARCVEYIRAKLLVLHGGMDAVGLVPSNIGVIVTIQYSFRDMRHAVTPQGHILDTHLRVDVGGPADVQDAICRVALRRQDMYFLNLQLKNYEVRSLNRPIMPGMQIVTIKPWEGAVEDAGVELLVDVNNNLASRVRRADAPVSQSDVLALIGELETALTTIAPEFVANGRVPLADRSSS